MTIFRLKFFKKCNGSFPFFQHGLSNITKSKADQLNKYIGSPRVLKDKMDIIYTSKIIKALSKQARNNEKVRRNQTKLFFLLRLRVLSRNMICFPTE